MYTPPAYEERDRHKLHAWMRDWSFATLVTHGQQGLQATHLPFLLDPLRGPHGTLISHLARRNPQAADIQAGAQAMVLFQGPHAFISPSWYRNQQTFPTWNYAAIHAHGQAAAIEDPQHIRAILTRTVQTYDTPLGGEWTFEAMPEDLILPRLSAIIALEIPIARLEGKVKLNQDKSPEDRAGVLAALENRRDPGSRGVARMMREALLA